MLLSEPISVAGCAQDTDELGRGHSPIPAAGVCQAPQSEVESLGGMVPKGN